MLSTTGCTLFKRVVDRPVAVLMLSLAAALFGALAYQQLPVALMPPLAYPTLTVQTSYQGAAPEEVESELTQPIEEQLSTLEGLMSMRSRSRPGMSEITLELRWGTRLDSALQRVYERLDRMRFPPEVDPPLVLRYDPTLDPLLVLSLSPQLERQERSTDRLSRQLEAASKQTATKPSGELMSDLGRAQLSLTRRYAEEVLAPQLYQVEGVAAVKVTGGERPLLDVRLNPDALQRLQLSVEDVTRSLSEAHVNLAGGLLHTERGDVLIRTLSEISSIEQLSSLVIQRPQRALNVSSETPTSREQALRGVRLGEIAEVERSFLERTSWVQLNETPAVRVQIYRQADSDLVEVSRSLRELLFKPNDQGGLQLKIPHPSGLRAALISDQARFIERALAEVNSAIAIGGLLAILILYAFLSSWSQTLIVAVAIPLSVILAFIPLQLAGVSLNLMSLGGLALGVGMLVDNAVVVLESISRRRERGAHAAIAAERGVAEVGGAVFASTLTTVAVFAPVAFIEGFAGQVFRDLALTVVAALLASLLVALFVVPTLAARMRVRDDAEDQGETTDTLAPVEVSPRLRADQWSQWRAQFREAGWGRRARLLGLIPLIHTEWSLSVIAINTLNTIAVTLWIVKIMISIPLWLVLTPLRYLSHLITRLNVWVTRAYLRSLRVVIWRPSLMIAIAIGLLFGAYLTYQQVARVLLPEVAQGVIIAELEYPVGTSIEGVQRRVQRWVDRLQRLPKVKRVDVLIGQDESAEQPGERREPHQARLTVQLSAPEEERSVQHTLRRWGNREAGATLKLSRPSLLSVKPPLRVVIFGQDLALLRRVEDEVVHLLHEIPQLSDLKRTFGQGFPEVKIEYDYAKLAHRGLTPREIADQVKSQLTGREALELIWSGERIPVRVRASYAETINQDDLAQLPIHAAQTRLGAVPLNSLAQLSMGEGPAELRHVDGARAAEITGRVPSAELEEVTEALRAQLSARSWPQGVEVRLAGQEREVAESSRELTTTLLISLFLVLVVMATQFESIRIPLLIMGSVPLAFTGVLFGLWSTQTPLSVVVFVGMITLSGVVVNNAIVFLDAAQRARSDGLASTLQEAIYWAGERRLRPILMTTLTTLFGLIPMLISSGEGSELRSPLALTLIFGLASSTLLLLYVIPALYLLFAPKQVGASSRHETPPPITSSDVRL